MVPPLREDQEIYEARSGRNNLNHGEKNEPASSLTSDVALQVNDESGGCISFSHVHLYVDRVEDLVEYKELEDRLNNLTRNGPDRSDIAACREFYLASAPPGDNSDTFEPQNRDVVKQLLAGFGFRVTGAYMPSTTNEISTKSVLVTSRDPSGVQIIVTAENHHQNAGSNRVDSHYHHFSSERVRRFYEAHSGRQGIAVLAFKVDSVDSVYRRYMEKHAKLVLNKSDYKDAKVLEVYAYYQGDTNESEADSGTVLRFVETIDDATNTSTCILPGISPVPATFDDSVQAAYCDHWVSNVNSRTGFLQTLEDTLNFKPKVDFNAGVVAAGEAQIESTVTGNETSIVSGDEQSALKDQSQVYLPINNALSDVGHVHGFLKEIGQGVQHVASRVESIISFVQHGNDNRRITGEGFTFLRIPRSYYGILSKKQLIQGIDSEENNLESSGLSDGCAEAVVRACESAGVVSSENAVDLDLTRDQVADLIESNLHELHRPEYSAKKATVLDIIMRSRYTNMYSLLGNHISEESYLGIVRNQILVDVQGEDLLYQIFTCNILQRNVGEEAPFFEFIQRVCSECKDTDGCPAKIRPGCGGFGIRNFLTLFLSIEVSKAMMEASRAKSMGDESKHVYAQQMVDCFTDQLNESNPILTEISEAMTLEGKCRERLEAALSDGNDDETSEWRSRMNEATAAKQVGNDKLMACSSKYKMLMRSIREDRASKLEALRE